MTFTFQSCVESVTYFVNSDLNNFENAQIACEGQGGQLAIPASLDRLNQITTAYNAVFTANTGVKAFVGLQDIENIGGTSGTRFLGVDGQVNAFSFVAQGEDPWASGQPDDASIENCAALSDNAVNIEDISCDVLLPSICELYCNFPAVDSLGDCVNSVQLYMTSNNQVTSFDEAQARCKSFDSTGSLAVPVDSDSFARMQTFYSINRAVTNRDGYIGLRDFKDIGGIQGQETNRFISVLTGLPESFTSGTVGQLPWRAGQPNDNNNNDNCVQLHRSSPHLLNDVACGNNDLFVCQRPCEVSPTGTPTGNPTGNPTSNPTKNPTSNPTESPTDNPTSSPTDNPTQNPTTGTPTEAPTTGTPTESPTTSPTDAPTPSPVIGQTNAPTTNTPTQNPTTSPTENPTKNPTTLAPTSSPVTPTTLTPTALAVSSEENSVIPMIAGALVGVCALFSLVVFAVVYRRRKQSSNTNKADELKAGIVALPAEIKTPVDQELGGMQMSANPLSQTQPKAAFALTPPPIVSTQRKTTDDDIATLDALIAANTPAKAPAPEFSSAPLIASQQRKTTDEDIATLDALVAANTPGTAPVIDEDIAMLDNLVAQNMKKPATVDEDVAALDALVAANTKPSNSPQENPPPMARPESAYIKSAELKPEDRRSIFAPSSEYIKKAADAKRKRDQPGEDDDDDLDI